MGKSRESTFAKLYEMNGSEVMRLDLESAG